MPEELITVQKMVIQDSIKQDDTVILTYKIEYPRFYSNYFSYEIDKVNHYYYMNALQTKRNYTTALLKGAMDDSYFARKNNFPFHAHEAIATYTVTYNEGCIVSLFFDSYMYLGGAHGDTVRSSQTWNMQKGEMMSLGELFNCNEDMEDNIEDYMKEYILTQVRKEVNQNPDDYYMNAWVAVGQEFNPSYFYVTPEGVMIYFQQYAIAPYCAGIQEFLLPYDECFVNPVEKCNPPY